MSSFVQKINEGYVSVPNEVIIILDTGAISNSIALKVQRPDQPDEYASLPNVLDAWIWLDKFNDIGGRRVEVENHKSVFNIPFECSTPYKYRFG